MAVIINGDTGIDKITDGSVVADDLASTLDLSGKTITLATDAAVVSKLSTASGSAPSYSARAWVNFNGSGTVAIRASGNVTSITDNGTGDYTVNFTTSMPDANYATVVTSSLSYALAQTGAFFVAGNSSSFGIICYSTNGTYYDETTLTASVFR